MLVSRLLKPVVHRCIFFIFPRIFLWPKSEHVHNLHMKMLAYNGLTCVVFVHIVDIINFHFLRSEKETMVYWLERKKKLLHFTTINKIEYYIAVRKEETLALGYKISLSLFFLRVKVSVVCVCVRQRKMEINEWRLPHWHNFFLS